MRKRFLSIALALGLVASLAAGAISVSADHVDVDEAVIHYDSIYFPWVPYNDTIDGVDGWHGSATIQNVHDELGVQIFVFNDDWTWSVANDPDVTFADALTGLPDDAQLFDAGERVPTFLLPPLASQSITPATLGLEEPGSGVSVFGVFRFAWEDAMRDEPHCGRDHPQGFEYARYQFDQETETGTCFYAPPVITGVEKQAADEPMSSMVRTSDDHQSVDGYTAIPFVDVSWGSQSDTCHELAGGVDFCDGAGYYVSPGGFGPGFNFDGHSYLPIAQTNDGWNTEIRLTNVDFTTTTAASVDVTLITTDQQGYGAPGSAKWSDTLGIPPGHTEIIDVESVVGPEWVGSVHITSEVGIATLAYRSKPTTNMLLTNTSAPSLWANPEAEGEFEFPENLATSQAVGTGDKYEQYAPLIFQNYNGWNSGVSFVNNAEATNTVTVTYYGPTGNVVGGDSRTISPLGQEFIYIPAQQDLNLGPGFVGSAVFSSDLPFHIAVDQVKYSTGEAMSYLATASGANHAQPGQPGFPDDPWPGTTGRNFLFLPLVQKGSQDGSGDISGIQLFNADAHNPIATNLTFYDGSGAAIAPTKDTPYVLTLGALHTGTVYTLNLSEMSQGQRSSLIVRTEFFEPPPGSADGQVVGVSNNVNYDVMGDGAAVYNMVNKHGQYRFPIPGFIPEFEEEENGIIEP